MRQATNGMEEETFLDYAVFRLTPTRTRCELLVAAGGNEERLVSGLLQPYCSHLEAVQEQVAQGGYSIVLDPHKGDMDAKETTWFTKGTMERFVRFVSTPEVLERVSIIDYELMKLEEALIIQSQDNSQFDNKNGILDSSSPPTGGSILYGLNGDRTYTNHAKSRSVSAEVNAFDTVENARCGLLKAMETRKYMLLKEQGMVFARAAAAGFSTDHISDLICFADCFGAGRMREACIKYLALYKQKQEVGVWLEDMDLINSEAPLPHPNNGHGIVETAKGTPETWFDTRNGVRGNATPGSNGIFYDGSLHVDENSSTYGVNGLDTLRSGSTCYNGVADSAFSSYQHESLPGFPGDMSSMAYCSPSFQMHGQNRFYSSTHSAEFAGNTHVDSGPELDHMNHRYVIPGVVPQPGSNAYYMLGNPQETNHYISHVSGNEPSQGLVGGYLTHPGIIPASEIVNIPASHRQFLMQHHQYHESFHANGYQAHDITQSHAHIPSAMNGHQRFGSPGSRAHEPSSDDSISHAYASDANVPVKNGKVSPIESNATKSNSESQAYIPPDKKTSSKRLHVGTASGKRSGVVLIKNINFITSNSQNDSTLGESVYKNTESDDNNGGDDGEADGENLPENAIQESKILIGNENLSAGPEDAMNPYCGQQDAENEPEKELEHMKRLHIKPVNDVLKSSFVPGDTGVDDARISGCAVFEDTFQGNKDQPLHKQGYYNFESEAFGHYEPQKKIISGNGYGQEMESSQLCYRTMIGDSEMMLFPTRESSLKSQSLNCSTEMALPHDQNESSGKNVKETSTFFLPEFCGLKKPVPLGNQLVTECMENASLNRNELIVANDSFIVLGKSFPYKQSNGSLESTFNMEAEYPVDEQKNANEEKREKKSVDHFESFDDLILLPERNLSCDSVLKSWVNPLDSEVSLFESGHNSTDISGMIMEKKSEENGGRISSELSPKEGTKTAAPAGKNEKLARRKSFPVVRAEKPSTKSASSASRNGNSWNSRPTIPLKSKKEKEEEERKRLEDLKMLRLERISSRSNASAPSKSVSSKPAASTSRVPKPPSPVGSSPKTNKLGSSHAKATSPSTLSKKSSLTTLGHAT